MKRTVLAIGIAVLASMMLVPLDAPTLYTVTIMRPFFFLFNCHSCSVHWTLFAATNGVCCRCRRCDRQPLCTKVVKGKCLMLSTIPTQAYARDDRCHREILPL